jgi:two-component system NtrC family response regulator
MHLPDNIRLKYIQSSIAQKKVKTGKQDSDLEPSQTGNTSIPLNLSQPLPSLKNIRDLVNEQVESLYLKNLMLSAQGDLDKASEISGLSKPRLYVLLKKHNIPRKKT